MKILKHKKIYLTISGLLVLLSLISVAIFGFNLSVDFQGGTVYEIQYSDNHPGLEEVNRAVQQAELTGAIVQQVGKDGFVIKVSELPDEAKEKLDAELTGAQNYQFEEKRLKSIGPSISSELTKKAGFAILLVMVIIILFIAFVFRQVSKPVSSWKFGLVAVAALLHDIIIPVGIFAFLGSFFVDYQIDVLFVTALLAILGYSVNDTIVIFDRIRENLKEEKKKESFEETVGRSLKQTITRSINTSITTFVVLFLLYLVGGSTTKPFALVLMIGVLIGTYSSIFLASPLLVLVEKLGRKND